MNGLIGLGLGGVVGVVLYRAVMALRDRVELQETRKVLRIVAITDLVAMPLIGGFIGAVVWPK